MRVVSMTQPSHAVIRRVLRMGEEIRSSDHLEDGDVVPRFPGQILEHSHHLSLFAFQEKGKENAVSEVCSG